MWGTVGFVLTLGLAKAWRSSHARARREKLDMVAKLKLNMVANLNA